METGRHSDRRGFKPGFHQDCVVMTRQGLLSIRPARLQYMDAGLRRMSMILDAKITGTHIELLHEDKARKKAVEIVPVQARHRSDSAFPAGAALMDEQPESSDMSLLMNLSRSFLQDLSEDQFVYTRNRHGAALSLPGASEIGESLDDGIHSRFLFPETLNTLYRAFSEDLQR
ncbi:hypothetical protein [Faecalibaculum rodentium]